MKRGACFWRSGCFILLFALFCKLDAAPKVLGVGGDPAIGLKEAGEVLIGELQCANCHEGAGSNPLSRRHGPDLTEVGQRVSSAYLLEFLTDPLGAHEGTKMPDLLGSMSDRDREEAASALTAFLRSLSQEKSLPRWEEKRNPKKGQVLFEEVGCLACHASPSEGPAGESGAGLGSLDHVARKYNQSSLAGFLHDPLRVRKSGRMPDFHLTRSEATDLAEYLLEGKQPENREPKPELERIEKGRVLFGQLNCVACHSLEGCPKPSLPWR